MDDLYRLNRQIAMHWLGRLGPAEETYLSQVTVCLGQLNHRAADVLQHLNELKARGANSLWIGKLNRRYLRFARRAAQESCGNRFDMLIRLGLTLEQAQLLRDMTDEDLERLAFGWGGPIIEFAADTFRRGANLLAYASALHASAMVSTRR
jgi:hypothetical protein